MANRSVYKQWERLGLHFCRGGGVGAFNLDLVARFHAVYQSGIGTVRYRTAVSPGLALFHATKDELEEQQ